MTLRRKSANRRPLSDRMAERKPRDMDAPSEQLLKTPTAMKADRADEIAVIAVGAMMLQRVREFGQTRAFERAIQKVVDKATAGLTAEEVMRLEVEAYEVLDWLLGDANPSEESPAPAASRDGDVVYYDPHAPFPAVVARAIDERFDLKIDYFSLKRGQMNTRRITPFAIEAETYVRAYCHARKAERVFRLNRITRCIPIGGRPLDKPLRLKAPEPGESRADEPRQISLLDDD